MEVYRERSDALDEGAMIVWREWFNHVERTR